MTLNFAPTLPSGRGGMASALVDQLGEIAGLTPSGRSAVLLRWLQDAGLSQANRSIRLRIPHGQQPFGDALVPGAIGITVPDSIQPHAGAHMGAVAAGRIQASAGQDICHVAGANMAFYATRSIEATAGQAQAMNAIAMHTHPVLWHEAVLKTNQQEARS